MSSGLTDERTPGRPAGGSFALGEGDLEVLLQALPCGALVCDDRGRIILANLRLAELFGWPLAELIGQPVEVLVPLGHRGGHETQRRAFAGPGERRPMGGRVIPGVRRDGGEILIEIGLDAITLQGRRLTVAAVNDLSDRIERKRLENVGRVLRERTQALAQREEELDILARNADGLAVVGEGRRILWSNSAADRVLGAGQEDDGVFPIHPLPGQTVEIQIHDFPDEPRWVECRMTSLQWAGEKAVLASIRDISERRRLEHERYASRSAWILGKLAGTVAHDFNNVLMAIQGSIDLALHSGDPDEVERHLREIRGGAERAAAFTRRLLTLGGAAVPGARVLDASRILRELEPALVRPSSDRVRIRLDVPDHPLPVKLEPGELEQIALTLVTNALDAIGDSGVVWLRAAALPGGTVFPCGCEEPVRLRSEHVLLEVADDGEGMSREVLDQIFEPFFSTRDGANSPGLGLTSVAAIVRRVGGHVCAQSRVGEGAVLRVMLPRADGEPEVDGGDDRLHGPVSGRSRRVLVVDDEAVIRQVVARHLRGLGFQVRAAADGREALRVHEEWGEPIDLLVTDVVMPHMDGLELAESLRKRQPGVRVLYISGYSTDALQRHAIDLDEVDLVAKPFGLNTLTEAIEDILSEDEVRELAAALR